MGLHEAVFVMTGPTRFISSGSSGYLVDDQVMPLIFLDSGVGGATSYGPDTSVDSDPLLLLLLNPALAAHTLYTLCTLSLYTRSVGLRVSIS